MTLPTVTISIAAATSSGTIPDDAVVTFELDGADVDALSGEIVIPDRTSVTLVNGVGTINKWPNGRGTQSTQYIVTIEGTSYRIAKRVTVPDSNCDLYTLMQFATLAPDAASAAEIAAQGYAATASVAAVSTAADAVATAADRVQTGLDRSAAAQSAADAEAAATAQNAELLAAVVTATPTSSDTVVGVTAAGAVRRFPAGFTQSGAGAVARTFQDKLREIVSVKDFSGVAGDSDGTAGNGTDNSAGFAAAIAQIKTAGDGYALMIPEGKYRFTSPVVIDAPLRLYGDGVAPYVTALGTVGNGSWLYFDHAGKGISIDGAATMSGIEVSGFGTIRNQPTPGAGWEPAANDYDIAIDNADVYINDVMLLNATKGVYVGNGGYGRLEMNRLRGQAFQEFLRVGMSADVVRGHNIHAWPFWSTNADVVAYMMANLDALYLERVDNAMFSNIFTIFARAGIRFAENASGRASKMRAANCDFDRGKYGIWVDSTSVTGITAQFTNLTVQSELGVAGAESIRVDGDNSRIDFGNFMSDVADQCGVDVNGTNNTLLFTGALRINNYAQANDGSVGIDVDSGNTVRIDGRPTMNRVFWSRALRRRRNHLHRRVASIHADRRKHGRDDNHRGRRERPISPQRRVA